MKILFLATYFPRPLNQTIGTWALEQAKAAIERLLIERRELQVERDQYRGEAREARAESERLYARAEQAEGELNGSNEGAQNENERGVLLRVLLGHGHDGDAHEETVSGDGPDGELP